MSLYYLIILSINHVCNEDNIENIYTHVINYKMIQLRGSSFSVLNITCTMNVMIATAERITLSVWLTVWLKLWSDMLSRWTSIMLLLLTQSTLLAQVDLAMVLDDGSSQLLTAGYMLILAGSADISTHVFLLIHTWYIHWYILLASSTQLCNFKPRSFGWWVMTEYSEF